MQNPALTVSLLVLLPLSVACAGSGPASEVSFLGDRFIVLCEPDAPALQTGAARDGCAVTGVESIDRLCRRYGVARVEAFYPGVLRRPGLARLAARLYRFRLAAGIDPRQVVPFFAADPHIQVAERQPIPRLLYTPNDLYFPFQWHLPHVQAPEAWDHVRDPVTRQATVGIVDTGLDLGHDDLAANIWVNEPEDLNGNGVLDPGDVNGLDDDGNGFIDDVVGWDFAEGDNDPQEGHPHGSGVGACASEVTDNGLLGAAIGFGVRLMALTAINVHGQLIDGYTPLLYAADNGAQVVNCSWGIPLYSEFEQEIVNAVWAEDVVIVAAGGEGDALTYPAAYDNVFAVSATDQGDHKPPFAPWGEYIDICAPGVDILTIWGDEFTSLTGTSFAAGMVAGLGGLLRAWRPDHTNAETVLLIAETADPIDHLNPGYEGLLGAGRINALSAVLAGAVGLAPDAPGRPDPLNVSCYPNPFNPRVVFSFELDRSCPVDLSIFDSRGRLVEVLAAGTLAAGPHTFSWSAESAASGTYFFVLSAGERQVIRKTTLLR